MPRRPTYRRYIQLAEFRFRLTRFLQFSEGAARECGISSLQYVALLHVRAFDAACGMSIGELAGRMLASHQATAALVQRCEVLDLLHKRRSRQDARRVELRLTPRGRFLLERLATRHLRELKRLDAVIHSAAVTRT